MDAIAILSRWTHIGTAIVVVGGTCFLRFVLAPAVAQLPEAEHAKLKELVMSKWKKFVHAGIALFIVSGFYNYLVAKSSQGRGKLYHPLMGTKILLAFAIFFIASALVGRSKVFEGMRKKTKMWQTVIIILAAVIVGISGYVKVALPVTPPVPNIAVQG